MSTEKITNDNRIAFYVAIGKILAMLAQFIMPLFLTRYLTKQDYGLYSQFYLIFGFLLSIFGMGMPSSLYFFYPKSSDKEKNSLVWGTYLMLIVVGLICCGVFMIPYVSHYIINNELLERYVFIISACVFLAMPSLMVDPLSVVRKDKLLAIFYHPSEIICKIILVIIFALLFKSLTAIFYGILILQFILFSLTLVYIIHHYHLSFGDLSLDLLKKQIAYSLPFGIAVILNTFAGRFDKLISISYLTAEEYATYSIAFFGVPGIMQIYDSLCQVNVTNMARLYKENNLGGVLSEYKSFVIKTLSFSLPVILVVFVYSPQIIELLFSSKYLDSVPFFRIYILTFILGMFGSGTILRAINRTKLSMKAYLISVLITIPLTILLVKHNGIWGAISAAVIGTVIPKIIQIFFEIRCVNSSIREYFPWMTMVRLLLISLLCLVPVILLNCVVNVSTLFAIFISAAYVILVYAIYIKQDTFIIDLNTVRTYCQKFIGKLSGR